jgi:hypothetical protein
MGCYELTEQEVGIAVFVDRQGIKGNKSLPPPGDPSVGLGVEICCENGVLWVMSTPKLPCVAPIF